MINKLFLAFFGQAILTIALLAQPSTEELRALCPLRPVMVSNENEFQAMLPDGKAVGEWLKQAKELCDTTLNKEQKPPMLLAQFRFQKEGPVIIDLAGQPELSKDLQEKLRASLSSLPTLNTRFGEAVFRLQSCPPDTGNPFRSAADFRPQLAQPLDLFLAKFEKATLEEKRALLSSWALETVLPVLGNTAASVEAKFAGVIAVGKSLQNVDPKKSLDADKLCFRSPDFWRGVMEMAPGNHLIQAVPVFVLIADGELDQATEFLSLEIPFSNKRSLAAYYQQLANKLLELFNKQLNASIQEGIALHDQGKYREAIAVYKKLLKAYPRSAWARYELFYSEVHLRGAEKLVEAGEPGGAWDQAAKEIYAFNPLYSTQFSGRKGRDMGDFKARLEAKLAPKEKNATADTVFGALATSCLKLGYYPAAALVYWNTLSTKINLVELNLGKEEKRALTKEQTWVRFMYCLTKLNSGSLASNLKEDPKEAFAELDRQLDAYRQQ